MEFKVGDIITATKKNTDDPAIKGLIKARVNYVYKFKDIIIADILEHEEGFRNGHEQAFYAAEGRFKLYEEPEVPESIVFKTKNFNAVVYRNGRRTIAKDRDTGEYAVATCSPEDAYDFMTGAIIAMARLTCTDPAALVNLERTISQK